MKKLMKTAVMITALIAGAGTACAETSGSAACSSAELKQMIRDARTPQQYDELASYYRWRQRDFEQNARAEKIEWDRRWLIQAGATMEKYPRPVDSSRNRYEYFIYEAQQMSRQAARFENLSISAAR